MYHQFKELAEVDITTEPMEVGPTCHYVMGGVEVDPDTEAARVPGLFAAGEVAGGHARVQPARRQLAVGPAGVRHGAPGWPRPSTRAGSRRGPPLPDDALADAARAALAPFDREGGENPYTVQHDLQQTMHDLVGIIRTAPEMEQALERHRGAEGAGREPVASRATGSTTPAGTSPSTCRTCCMCQRVHRAGGARTRRRAAAATPATTSRAPIRSGARST